MPQRYQTLSVRQDIQKRIRQMEECKANPTAWETIQNKGEFMKDLASEKTRLDAITPPDTTGSEKDKLKVRIDALEQALLDGNAEVPPMNSEREQWEAPNSAVDKLTSWERYWKRHTLAEDNKTIIPVVPQNGGRGGSFELKDLRRIYYKEQEDDRPSVASLEMIRRRDSHVPLSDVSRRTYGLTPAGREAYDAAFPEHEPTPVERRFKRRGRPRKIPIAAKPAVQKPVETPPVEPS